MTANGTGTRHRTAFTARMLSVMLHAARFRSLVAKLAAEQAAALEPRHAAMMEAAE
jgi:hypothetical protein